MKLKINGQSLYQSIFSLQLSRIYIAVFILLFGVGAEAFAQTNNYTPFTVPNAAYTLPQGINDSGIVTGFTYRGTFVTRAFIRDNNGSIVEFEYPGSVGGCCNKELNLRGINNSGDMVGYSMSLGFGFKVNRASNLTLLSSYTFFVFPGAQRTESYGISNSGDIVGTYGFNNSTRGFKRSNTGNFETIDFPGATATFPRGINIAGDIVGFCTISNVERGFLFKNGIYTLIDFPGALQGSTKAFGINDSGVIVGSYTPNVPNTGSRGFKLIGSNYTTITVPTSSYSITSINNLGDVAGNGSTSSGAFGFKLNAGNTSLTATVQTNPVGRSFTVDGVTYNSTQTFTWQSGAAHTIGTNSPQTGSSGTQYVWSNWSDGGAITHTVSPTANATYTANFTTPIPVVSEVIREFPGFFLTGYDGTNNFDVRVDWKGTTGRVRFQINDGTPFEIVGTSAGVVKAFNLTNDFTASFAPSIIKITPINGGGVVGETRTEQIHIFPYPNWLTFALTTNPSALSFTTQPGEIRANFNVKYPNPAFKASGQFESYIPFLGGELGIATAQGTFTGYASSLGTGSLTLGGETKFKGLGQELSGGANGTGNFLLNQSGLSVTGASLNLNVAGTVSKEESLVSAIPALAPFRRFAAVRAFTDSVKLRGEASPSFAFATTWKQDPTTRDLVFNEATGTSDYR